MRGTWKQRKKEDNGMNGGGDRKGRCGQYPHSDPEPLVTPEGESSCQSVLVRPGDDKRLAVPRPSADRSERGQDRE